MTQSGNERLKEIAKYWNEHRKSLVFDISAFKSASGCDGIYIGYCGMVEFIPKLSIEQCKGFERSMWAVMLGGKSKYLK